MPPRAYLPPQCTQTSIKLGWDDSRTMVYSIGIPKILSPLDEHLAALRLAVQTIEDVEVLGDEHHSEGLDGDRCVQAGQVLGGILLAEDVGGDDATASATAYKNRSTDSTFELAN